MSKTVKALDELISSIITLVPTWLSMCKSTRVLTLVGTGVIMYLTATQGGLTETQTMITQAAEALLGISFIGFKTLRSESKPVETHVTPVEVQPEPEIKPPVELAPPIPFNADEFLKKCYEFAKNDYPEVNDATVYYSARKIVREGVLKYNNNQAWQDCWNMIYKLVGNAFKMVWGESYEDAQINIHKPDISGCTYPNLKYKAMQLSMAHYAILLELEGVKEVV